jgi:glycosyltransferase involved in cell wall biosynthesis
MPAPDRNLRTPVEARSKGGSPFAPRAGVSVLVLSFNEEANIERCLRSLRLLSDDIWVVDSGSTDRTVELARAMGAQVEIRPWLGYARQWNWGLCELPFRYPFVMIHASDEQIPEAWAREFKGALDSDEPPDMVVTAFRFWWMGRPIEHGNYGRTYIVKAGRRDLMRYEDRSCNEHIPWQGRVYRMKERYEHHDAKELQHWFEKHVRYAQLEATEREAARSRKDGSRSSPLKPGQRVRWLREQVYDRIPMFVRPAAYFAYRYIGGAGWRDGLTGSIFHYLHGFWFPFLIDVFELERRLSDEGKL